MNEPTTAEPTSFTEETKESRQLPRQPSPAQPAAAPSGKRLYRIADNKYATRDIAALDFLLNIPLEREAEIVNSGWTRQQQLDREEVDSSAASSEKRENVVEKTILSGRWWEKFISKTQHGIPKSVTRLESSSSDQLERPTLAERDDAAPSKIHISYAPPGRRLDGDKAINIQIPLTTNTITKQRSIARLAALREFELKTAYGFSNHPPLLDGRLFFSAKESYPISVFSIIRYEPKKEEAVLRRQKLEARGGGGSEFIIPARDWRGISYRALLPSKRATQHTRKFNRFLKRNHQHQQEEDGDDHSSSSSSNSSSSSDDSDVYVPGLLDDPDMTMGRHRNVMIGDCVTGPMVASTIQFVEPSRLKAELNSQFRERFDGWEPSKSARRYIGGKVVQGAYVLMDPADTTGDRTTGGESYEERSLEKRKGSTVSVSSTDSGPKEQIRMPPSLTLSKIRSLKHQLLKAAVKAKLEIATVALSYVYFERLCLDCRVDKSNRRLTMAACLLLASKLNEPNIGLVMQTEEEEDENGEDASGSGENITTRIQSLIRPNKRSNTMFASLLEFFTEEWSLSLKHLFEAEWGVFVALGFSLLAEPSHIAFHFRRVLKSLDLSPLNYLGETMYEQWQVALKDEEERRKEKEMRKEKRQLEKEKQLLNLHIEIENEVLRRKKKVGDGGDSPKTERASGGTTKPSPSKIKGMKLLHRFGMRRVNSHERISTQSEHHTIHASLLPKKPRILRAGAGAGLSMSPSMPAIATTFPDAVAVVDVPANRGTKSETASSLGSEGSDRGIILV